MGTWSEIISSPRRMYGLYSHTQPLARETFNTDLMGYIERRQDGRWICFLSAPSRDQYLGIEPTRGYAMARVWDAVCHEYKQPCPYSVTGWAWAYNDGGCTCKPWPMLYWHVRERCRVCLLRYWTLSTPRPRA